MAMPEAPAAPAGTAAADDGALQGLVVVELEQEPGAFAVRFLHEGEWQELEPLDLARAQFICDTLRLKVALDAGSSLDALPLIRPLESHRHLLQDLSSESLEEVMDTLAAGAAAADEEEAGGEQELGGEEEVAGEAPAAPDAASAEALPPLLHQPERLLELQAQPSVGLAATAPVGEAGAAAGTAAAQGELAIKQESQWPPAEPNAGDAQLGTAPAPPTQPQQAQAQAQQTQADEAADAALAHRLQAELAAADYRSGRQRRTAAPTEGSLQIPRPHNWGGMQAGRRQGPGERPLGASGGASTVGGPAAQGSRLGGGGSWGDEGEQEQQVAFAGVAPLQDEQSESGGQEEEEEGRGNAEERRWRATISAPLDEQTHPSVAGKPWRGGVCDCGSQEEAAVARDLALLWREQRLGYLGGELTWQPEEYNFDLHGYHAAVDIGPRLQLCQTIAELRPLLAELRDSGRLVQLAGSLARNPLSRTPPLPPPEPPSQATKARFKNVQPSNQPAKPWRAVLVARQGDPRPPKSMGIFTTAAQAAAAADLSVVWREEVRGGERRTSQPLLNFPRSGYKEPVEAWRRLHAADSEADLRLLFKKLRNSSVLQQVAERQLAAAAAAGPALAGASTQSGGAAAADSGLGRLPKPAAAASGEAKKRRRPGPRPAGIASRQNSRQAMPATAAAAAAGALPWLGTAKPSKRMKQEQQQGWSTVPAAPDGPAAPAAAANGAAGAAAAGAVELPDPMALLRALLQAAKSPGGQQAGLTPELAAVFMLALQSVDYVAQRQQIEQLLFCLGEQEHGMVVSFVTAAIKKQGLDG